MTERSVPQVDLRRSLRLLAAVALTVAVGLALVCAQPIPTDLHSAIRTGEVATVQASLNSGADVNGADQWGRTALIVALQQGKSPVVELLLGRGASVGTADAWGRTPLLVATQLRNNAAVRLLLDRKPDVNVANKNDITPLIAAAQTGNQEGAAMLLAAGADTGRPDNLGRTALMWAAYRNDEAMVKLLQRGAAAEPQRIARPEGTPLPQARRASPAIDPDRIVRGNPKAAIPVRLERDLHGPIPRERLAVDLRESEQYGFDGVPAFVVDGFVIEGARPSKVFFDLIDSATQR